MDNDNKKIQDQQKKSRQEDVRIEGVCGRFLDENFYSKLGCQFERNSVLSSQYLGVDVIVQCEDRQFILDEKCKYVGTVNRAIGCPSFEITRLDRAGRRGIGWYASDGQLTNAYLFISPFVADGGQEITDESLSATQVLIVPKNSVQQLAKECGLSDMDIIEKAEALVNAYEKGLYRGDKAYDRVSPGKLWLTYSAGLREKPVNMVIPRDELRKLTGVADLYVTRESIKRV